MKHLAAACIMLAILPAGAVAAGADLRLIPVPRTTLYPGDLVTPSAVMLKRFTFPPGAEARYVSDPSQLGGKEARRTLAAGKPIAFASLRNPEVVKKGRPAPGVYAVNGLVIFAQLVPLQSGAAGERIEARNADSGKVVPAVIQPDGSLRVEAP